MRFGIVDLSLAPTPAMGDNVAEILEILGLERTGCHGTTAALALLTDAVKKAAQWRPAASVVYQDLHSSVRRSRHGRSGQVCALSLDKLEAMTAVCSVGLDMVAVPGDTSPAMLSAIIADEISIGTFNNKTTAVQIISGAGQRSGWVDFGGLLGQKRS